MQKDPWIVYENGCEFDLLVGFEAEWDALRNPFVVVDLETTGPNPESGEILEISALLVEPSGTITAEFSMLVSGCKSLPEFIKQETGITQAEIDETGKPLADALTGLFAFVAERPVFIHNAPFDMAFLLDAASRSSQKFENTIFDTMDISLMIWSTVDWQSIYALADHLGIQMTGRRAIDDAKATLSVLMAAREQAILESHWPSRNRNT